jgi:hypothetical protein
LGNEVDEHMVRAGVLSRSWRSRALVGALLVILALLGGPSAITLAGDPDLEDRPRRKAVKAAREAKLEAPPTAGQRGAEDEQSSDDQESASMPSSSPASAPTSPTSSQSLLATLRARRAPESPMTSPETSVEAMTPTTHGWLEVILVWNRERGLALREKRFVVSVGGVAKQEGSDYEPVTTRQGLPFDLVGGLFPATPGAMKNVRVSAVGISPPNILMRTPEQERPIHLDWPEVIIHPGMTTILYGTVLTVVNLDGQVDSRITGNPPIVIPGKGVKSRQVVFRK